MVIYPQALSLRVDSKVAPLLLHHYRYLGSPAHVVVIYPQALSLRVDSKVAPLLLHHYRYLKPAPTHNESGLV
ncbi:hypothetical protein QUF63_03490 [Anaerolineales bacterium HSG25]|nr:hypothetical protein [Anaerolineales bacterium HSG25]